MELQTLQEIPLVCHLAVLMEGEVKMAKAATVARLLRAVAAPP